MGIADERTVKTYFKYLQDAGLIRVIPHGKNKMKKIEIPGKIYLDNPNQLYAISSQTQNTGTVREIFFLDMLSFWHEVTIPKHGDFLVNDFIFEIGGKNKDFSQFKGKSNAEYLIVDDVIEGSGRRIPLWLFGFLY